MKSCLFRLNSQGLSHIREELGAANPFGQMILNTVKFSEGSCFAVVPSGSRADPYSFRTSIHERRSTFRVPIEGGYAEQVESTESDVTDWIERVLMLDPKALLVAESYLLRATDLARAAPLPRRTLTCGQFVYHVSVTGDTRDEIGSTVDTVYPVPLGLGAIVSLPGNARDFLTNRNQLHDSDLLEFARGVKALLLGAYDGESVIVWLHDMLSLRPPLCSTEAG